MCDNETRKNSLAVLSVNTFWLKTPVIFALVSTVTFTGLLVNFSKALNRKDCIIFSFKMQKTTFFILKTSLFRLIN